MITDFSIRYYVQQIRRKMITKIIPNKKKYNRKKNNKNATTE